MNSIKDRFKDWVAVAGDLGPFQTVQVISSSVSCHQLSLNSDGIQNISYWVNFFIEKKISGLFCGTSKSKLGFRFESNIRIAACKLNLPVVCIEDFFGNYIEILGTYTSILIVEDEIFLNLYKKRLNKTHYLLVCPSIRYDYLRGSLFNFLQKEKNHSYSKKALWIGQPESEFNFLTLKHIASRLNLLSVTLLFRAHPRDNLYKSGAYQRYFNSIEISWIDVTKDDLKKIISNGVSLVITQFSSLAIEAGFYGIPILNVLLEKAGKKLLLTKTGFSKLISTHYDAAFLMNDKSSLDFMDLCFTDTKRRGEVISNFNSLYKVNEKQLLRLLIKIQDIISGCTNKDFK